MARHLFPLCRHQEAQGGVRGRVAPGAEGSKRRRIQKVRSECAADIEREKFGQFLFFTQWQALKEYCNRAGHADDGRYAHIRELRQRRCVGQYEHLQAGRGKAADCVSGRSPDYFSATGQLWGNPVYNWDALKLDGLCVVDRTAQPYPDPSTTW